jgi:hypothetical protein
MHFDLPSGGGVGDPLGLSDAVFDSIRCSCTPRRERAGKRFGNRFCDLRQGLVKADRPSSCVLSESVVMQQHSPGQGSGSRLGLFGIRAAAAPVSLARNRIDPTDSVVCPDSSGRRGSEDANEWVTVGVSLIHTARLRASGVSVQRRVGCSCGGVD